MGRNGPALVGFPFYRPGLDGHALNGRGGRRVPRACRCQSITKTRRAGCSSRASTMPHPSTRFPTKEAVCVYTRWSGSGTHQIGISIWNMDTEETVSEAAQGRRVLR